MTDRTSVTSHSIWFDRPAETWVEALPIGDGHRGAMCFGGVARERIQVNDTTGWSGGPDTERSGNVPSAEICQAAIVDSRRAVEVGDWGAADEALKKIQHGYPQSFVPVADLGIRIRQAEERPDAVSGYRRRLDLATAVHEVTCSIDGNPLRVSSRASWPHGVLLVVIDVEGGRGLDLDIELTSPVCIVGSRNLEEGTDLLLRFPDDVAPDKVDAPNPVRYGVGEQSALNGAVSLRWTHDGTRTDSSPGVLSAIAVHHAEIYLTTQTNFEGLGKLLNGTAEEACSKAVGRIDAARSAGAVAVAAAQIADHSALYERCALETTTSERVELPINARLGRAYHAESGPLVEDPGLAGLLFNFGRYLLISSSREGGLPANLQGIWNDKLQPPWSSDYTTNINLEMNYWLAEQTDLPECLSPLFDYIEALALSGEETARRVFGAPGWVAFHCSDAWAYTQSVGDGTHDPSWAFWPMGGPWLLQHMRERLRFGGCDDVAERAWPLTRSAAEFYLHFLVEQPDGSLGTNPSTSPENHFTSPDGVRGATARSSTMDISLVTDLFRFVGELAGRLSVGDDPVAQAAAKALMHLPGPKIGADGKIQEWSDECIRPDPDHRHLAHLYFVHPGDGPLTPELAEAVGRSIEGRGDESTGWSLVWKMAMRARLRQPDKVSDLLRLLFRDATIYRGPYAGGLYSNLFAAHPPFQIDANFGFVAAMGECLLQSHTGTIDLLPAVPAELQSGSVTGLISRPGIAVDLRWKDGELVSARLEARHRASGRHRVRYGSVEIPVDLRVGVPVELDLASFATTKEDAS